MNLSSKVLLLFLDFSATCFYDLLTIYDLFLRDGKCTFQSCDDNYENVTLLAISNSKSFLVSLLITWLFTPHVDLWPLFQEHCFGLKLKSWHIYSDFLLQIKVTWDRQKCCCDLFAEVIIYSLQRHFTGHRDRTLSEDMTNSNAIYWVSEQWALCDCDWKFALHSKTDLTLVVLILFNGN